MKRLPRPICPWCGCELRERRASNAPPICRDCHILLRNLPHEKLVNMIAYFAGYSQVALRLLKEGNALVTGVTAGTVPGNLLPNLRGKKPQGGIASPSVAPGRRSIA